nr:hypothetical protein [Oxalobacteraceae bacterium]
MPNLVNHSGPFHPDDLTRDVPGGSSQKTAATPPEVTAPKQPAAEVKKAEGTAGTPKYTGVLWFIYAFVRKEAVVSSQIEGTQSSLSDLLLFENEEAPGVPIDDVQEVSSYVAAMEHGLERIRAGFPISLRLIRELHDILLSKGRGNSKQPGEFRRTQNWIGGTRPGNALFVPPPPELVMELMSLTCRISSYHGLLGNSFRGALC